jgi:splicing factor 45
MALYDDLDAKQGSDKVGGWSSGIKLLQSQLAVKKASLNVSQNSGNIRNVLRKPTTVKNPPPALNFLY